MTHNSPKWLRSAISVLIACGCGLESTAADFIVDQFQLNGLDQNQAVHSARPVGQSFTVGTEGWLSGVELSLYETGSGGDMVVEVLDMSAGGGVPSASPVLGSVSIAETELGPFPPALDVSAATATFIDLSELNIWVRPGDFLAIRLTSPRVLPNLYAIRIDFEAGYEGGTFFVGDGLFSGGGLTDGDAAFKTFISLDEPTVLERIDEILAFFDIGVEEGGLMGVGSGKSARNRLAAFGNILLEVRRLIAEEDYDKAYEEVMSALKKTDGKKMPPDFVAGSSAPALAIMLEELADSIDETPYQLAGQWLLTNYSGNSFGVTLEERPDGQYYLSSPDYNIVSAGVYEVQGDTLVMIKPDNPYYSGFVWKIHSNSYLELVTTGYQGSTMTR